MLTVIVSAGVMGTIITLAALGLTLTYGTTRFINFAFGDLMTVGAYAAMVGVTIFGLISGILFAVIFTGIIGMLIAWIIFRPIRERGPLVLLLSSIGVAWILRYSLLSIFGAEGKSFPAGLGAQTVGNLPISQVEVTILIMGLLCFIFIYFFLYKTSHGRSVRAISANIDLARIIGTNTERMISLTWMMGCSLAGLGGIAYFMIAPVAPMMGWDYMLFIFTAVLVGGIGRPVGALIGGYSIGFIHEFTSVSWEPGYAFAVVFLLLVLFLLFKPEGIMRSRV